MAYHRSFLYGLLLLTSANAFVLPGVSRVQRKSHTTQFAGVSADFYYDISKLPCNEGNVTVSRDSETYELSYKLVRPMSLSSRQAAAVVVLHGGPSVPSDYLLPLAKVVPYRSILFYDQLGCGTSDEPDDLSCYSIDKAVDDLQVLLEKKGVRRFHLFGHSFGGILAYEYLKRQSLDPDNVKDQECLSIILASAPPNVRQVEREAELLIAKLDDPNAFRRTHQCRTSVLPKPLADAESKGGSVWRGSGVIKDYAATAPSDDAATMPRAMLLRGEHDFVSTDCLAAWKDILNSKSVREKTLPGCSHHGLLEDPVAYGDMVDSFFAEFD